MLVAIFVVILVATFVAILVAIIVIVAMCIKGINPCDEVKKNQQLAVVKSSVATENAKLDRMSKDEADRRRKAPVLSHWLELAGPCSCSQAVASFFQERQPVIQGQQPLQIVSAIQMQIDGQKIVYAEFKPFYTPSQMLSMGVFEGKYINDCDHEFPKEWYTRANKYNKLSPKKADPSVNYFKIKSRLSLQEWKKRGWIPVHTKDKDVRGWFQWYCRYWIGRRIPR